MHLEHLVIPPPEAKLQTNCVRAWIDCGDGASNYFARRVLLETVVFMPCFINHFAGESADFRHTTKINLVLCARALT